MAALALFVYAGATDLVDGWIARRWSLQTVVGTVIDPMADKALMTVLTVSLAMKGAVPREQLSSIISCIIRRLSNRRSPSGRTHTWPRHPPESRCRLLSLHLSASA